MSTSVRSMSRLLLLTIMFCSVVMTTVVRAEVSKEDMMKDWREAAALAKEFGPIRFRNVFKREPIESVQKFKAFDVKFQPFWKRIESRGYERDSHGRFPAFENLKKPLDIDVDFFSAYNTLLSAVDHGKDVAEWCSDTAETSYRNWKRNAEEAHPHKVELYLDYAERALACYKAAKELQPQGDWDSNIKIAAEAVALQQQRFEKNLSHPDMQWPPNNPKWQGEGSPDALCEAALSFLKDNPKRWGDAYQDDLGAPIAVSLYSKDWKVHKKNILSKPTQYSLDFTVAFASKSGSRFAYRFHYSFYTKEELGVAKAPPFSYCNPHQYAHFKMLASAVPGGGGGSTVSGAGRLWQLALVLACLVAGLLAAAPLINKKVPALASIYETLTPLRNLIGVIALAIGLLDFLRVTLLSFQPHADILPQAVVVVTGLFLGKELLMKKPAVAEQTGADAKADGSSVEDAPADDAKTDDATADDATADDATAKEEDKVEAAMEAAGDAAEAAGEAAKQAATAARDLLIKHKEKIEALEKYQVPMGVASLAFGVLHLLLGGYPLF